MYKKIEQLKHMTHLLPVLVGVFFLKWRDTAWGGNSLRHFLCYGHAYPVGAQVMLLL